MNGMRNRIAVGLLSLIVVRPVAADAQTAVSTRIVSVGGHTMRAQVAGLDVRRPGTPVVVFEAGALQSSGNWGRILNDIAATAPVVAYDRAGLGQSAWDSQTPTPRHVVTRLRQLLQQLDAPPPYLLVGYSWGGSLARYFAGYHPAEVAGIVYVDPGPIVTQSIDDEITPYNAIGAGRGGYDTFWSAYEAFVANVPSAAAKPEFFVYRDLMRIDPAARDLKPGPNVPTAMIIAAKQQVLPLQLPYDAAAHFHADIRHRIAKLQEWALSSSNATIVVSNTTTHAVLREDPELVVWATKRVFAAISARR
jgi:pimeloyl-ACP methyl ester carboxylesterase